MTQPTQPLFDDDPYRREFTSTVTAVKKVAENTWVAFEHTAFYPEGGGQPADRGYVQLLSGSFAVSDVQVDEDGVIWHCLLPEAMAEEGVQWPQVTESVTGTIDWGRRLDHMQQHCGQHILSQAFVQQVGAETVGFHLGEVYCTIDLDVTTLSAEHVLAVETVANQEVWAADPIRVVRVDAQGAKAYRLRKPVHRENHIRIVAIGDFDHSGCGGTHPSTTAEVGLIKVTGWEKTRGRTRVEFVCGWRALRDYQDRFRVTQVIASTLGLHWQEAPHGTQALKAQLSAAVTRQEKLAGQLAHVQAAGLLQQAVRVGATQLVVYAGQEEAPQELRLLAQRLVEQAEGPMIALLYNQVATPHVLLVRTGTPKDAGPSMVALLQPFLTELGGRGGGSPIQAQGGLPSIEAAERLALQTVTCLQGMPTMREGW